MPNHTTEIALFGAGCFWGVQALFDSAPGVKETTVGYSGGHIKEPTYEAVCTGNTDHAEVIQIKYDPTTTNFKTLLMLFFEHHDPTTLNRQGPDIGTQYRSVIFYHSPEQKQLAEACISELNESKKFNAPIVTEITPAQTFYPAEDYHQHYLAKRNLQSCKIK